MTMTSKLAAIALAATALASAPAFAVVDDYSFGFTNLATKAVLVINGTTTLNATNQGNYNSTGTNVANDYIVGTQSNVSYNDYFVFNLASVSGTINSAVLELIQPPSGVNHNNGFSGANATYTNYDVSTTIANLTSATPTGGASIYTDLGTGTSYGSSGVSTASNGTTVNVTLNAAARSAIQAAETGSFAIGGTLTTNVATVPLPAALPMFLAALLGMFGIHSFRKQRQAA
jgi:hypothetical protein